VRETQIDIENASPLLTRHCFQLGHIVVQQPRWQGRISALHLEVAVVVPAEEHAGAAQQTGVEAVGVDRQRQLVELSVWQAFADVEDVDVVGAPAVQESAQRRHGRPTPQGAGGQ